MERKHEDNNTNKRLNTKRTEDSKTSTNKIIDKTRKDLYSNLGTPKMDKVISNTKNSLKK